VLRVDVRIEAALQMLLEDRELPTVSQLARSADLSISGFSHLFVRRTGILPSSFLLLLKRFHAEELLVEHVLAATSCPVRWPRRREVEDLIARTEHDTFAQP
jgi:AraC-like DNA-binding protein